MSKRVFPVPMWLVVGLLPALASAAVVSINFTGGDPGFPLTGTDLAGNPNVPDCFTANWNNAVGASGSGLSLVDSANAATSLVLAYSTGLGTWSIPNTTTGANLSGGANPQMMQGYLDAAGAGQEGVVTITGLTGYFKSYQVAIYFDGDNGTDWRVAQYTITNTTTSEQLFQGSGEDSEGVNFNGPATIDGNRNENPNGLFQIPVSGGGGNQMWPVTGGNNGEGNFLISGALTADSITITAVGTAAGGTLRAPINGLQIIGPPLNAPTVTITAGTSAAEPAIPGSFTVTRSGNTSGTLVVLYTVGGTAVAGVDYETLSGSVTIPANQAQATFTVTPIDDGEVENPETIVVTLAPKSDYEVGTPDNASIELTDDDVAATVTVQATDSAAAEIVGNTGLFTVTRTGGSNTLFPLTVNYSLSGTATNGADYRYLAGTTVIPAGASSATIAVVPFEDGTTEGAETAVLAIAPSGTALPQYVIGAEGSATVTIADDGAWSHWTQSLSLVFSGYIGSEALTDFPVLVVLTPGYVGDYAGFAAEGADIRFRAGDISLPYEIEQWNPAGASYVWVRVPQIASDTDAITLVWNNPAAIDAQCPNVLWSNDYVGVWHLNAVGPNGKYTNSTMTGSDGTNYGATPVQGWMGGALSFNATNSNYIDTGNTEQIDNFTVLTFVSSPTAPVSESASGPVHREANYQINWNHGQDAFRASVGVQVGSGWYAASAGPLAANTWYMLAGTYDGETLSAYRNGELITANTDPSGVPGTETNSLKFARHAAAESYFDGVIDEVQVLRAARSAGWVANQYASMSNNFISYGGVFADVQIVASQPNAAEPNTNGEFLVTRSGGRLDLPLTIYYQVSGTATPGKDYTALPAQVTLAGGQTQAVLPVSVIQDWLPFEGPETVVLTLTDRADYNITGSASATVTIADADAITDWQNRKRIGFGGYVGTTPLHDFPTLVILTPAGTNNYAGFAAGGADLRFSDSDQTVFLPYEIEQWDPVGTSLIWVKVPLIDSPQDYIWMYWNNPGIPDGQDPGSVWTADYLAVYHFGDPAAIPDSTANNHDGTNTNSTSEAGAVGLGRGFNGTDAYIDLGSNFMNDLGSFTVSGWISPGAASFADRISLFGQNDLIEYGFHGGAYLQAWVSAGGTWPGLATTYAYSTDEWHYIVLVGNATSLLQYVDGVLVNSRTDLNVTNQGTSGYSAKIGGGVIDEMGGWYSGLVDEVRFSATERSADWIAAEYLAMTGMLSRCGTPTVDVDQDGDVDMDDFSVFQRCFTGIEQQQTNPDCTCVETTGDRYITAEDLANFIKCASGPAVKADPDCLTAP